MISNFKNVFLNFLRGIKHGGRRKIFKFIMNIIRIRIYKKIDGKVYSGIFKGIKLIDQQVFGSITAMLLGTYEKELFPVLIQIKLSKPKTVINVGSAEGYYAIGISRLWGVDKTIVFELMQEGRDLVTKNARLNNIEQKIDLRSECTEEILNNILEKENVDFLVMDIEGAELDVLSKRVAANLKKSIVLIESHDFCRPGCIEKLKNLFSDNHKIQIISSQKRTYLDFPYKSMLPRKVQETLIDERRPEVMKWLVGFPILISQ